MPRRLAANERARGMLCYLGTPSHLPTAPSPPSPKALTLTVGAGGSRCEERTRSARRKTWDGRLLELSRLQNTRAEMRFKCAITDVRHITPQHQVRSTCMHLACRSLTRCVVRPCCCSRSVGENSCDCPSLQPTANMGRVRTKTTKRASRGESAAPLREMGIRGERGAARRDEKMGEEETDSGMLCANGD